MKGKIKNINEKLENLKNLGAYKVKSHSEIPEIQSVGVVLEHIKTGAKVFVLLCDDTNKCFYIGFRTPPQDDTGVAHIIEHSVLCGSDKYPCKDPFVELAKGSLNTFLNAMTYPDKTVYPVASVNTKDFENLMDVYLDAVFHPNIYKEPKIFMQEGWHYELNRDTDELTINGVVYNEMKGAYSDPDDTLDVATNSILFPGHPYGYESGGDPEAIPELTYENFIKFHQTYYHPSNAYIYLYGDVDAAKYLDYIDREYLSHYDKIHPKSQIPAVAQWDGMRNSHVTYAIAENENSTNATTLSWNKLVGCADDPIKYTAFLLLEDVLMSVPGALINDALIKAGIGTSVSGGYTTGLNTPYFAVTTKMAEEDQKDRFLEIIYDVLAKAANEGLPKDMLYAAINSMEFSKREAIYILKPKGLVYGLDILKSWLYDLDPFMHIRFQEKLEILKKNVETGYFENLIKEYLLDGNSQAMIVMTPEKGKTLKKQKELNIKLDEYKKILTDNQKKAIIENQKALKAYQTEPSSKEDIMKIPLLHISDISRDVKPPIYEEKSIGDTRVIHSDMFTSDIIYIHLFFGLGKLTDEEISRVALLKKVLGHIDTAKYTYAQLSTKTDLVSGGISYTIMSAPEYASKDRSVYYMLCASIKVMPEHVGETYDLVDQVIFHSCLDNTSRLKEILRETKTFTKEFIAPCGDIVAAYRSIAHVSNNGKFSELANGIAYYRYLENLEKSGDMNKLAKDLKVLANKIFSRENAIIGVVCDDKGYPIFEKYTKDWLETLSHGESMQVLVPSPSDYPMVKEVFGTSSQVNYVARSGNYVKHGFKYNGALAVLKGMLGYEYLWSNIRVTGGAYGCMADFAKNGDTFFTSYRDPNIDKTRDVYEGILDFVSNCHYDEREMTKYILGAIRTLDRPRAPAVEGHKGILACITHIDPKEEQRERNEILDATSEDIRNLAPLIKAVLSDGNECIISSEKSMSTEALDIECKGLLFEGE